MASSIQSVILNIEAILPGAMKIYRALETQYGADAARLRERLAESAPPLASGAEERLRAWRACVELGLIAGLPLKTTGEWIKQAGLRDVFQILVGSEHAGKPWPDAAYYRMAVGRTRREANACLFVDVSREGVRSAIESGARAAAIGSGMAGWRIARAGTELVAKSIDDPALDRLIRG